MRIIKRLKENQELEEIESVKSDKNVGGIFFCIWILQRCRLVLKTSGASQSSTTARERLSSQKTHWNNAVGTRKCLFFCFNKYSPREVYNLLWQWLGVWDRPEKRTQWKFSKKRGNKLKRTNGTPETWSWRCSRKVMN